MPEMEAQSKIKAYCLKVPKNLGEKTIRLATELSLLSRDLKVRSDKEIILVPLNRKPTASKVSELKRTLPHLYITIEDFEPRAKRPRSISGVLGDQLPPYLLASVPRAIDFVGDIAVLEVPQELEKEKKLIGEAALQTYRRVRTVLAKSSAVAGTYRLREYEVIAGPPNTETIHKEHGCKYHLDLGKVYFSPRLSHERKNIASQVGENETVIDMFAGVGPFSVLIAKTHRNVKVYAIDINPEAIKYLERNTIVNGVWRNVIPLLGDAADIARSKLRGVADRVIMNLPEKAAEYLEAASDAVKPSGGIIHYYEFAEGPSFLNAIKERVTETMKKTRRKLERIPEARIVREVAPFRWQIAVDLLIR